jgi:hypothetical protein
MSKRFTRRLGEPEKGPSPHVAMLAAALLTLAVMTPLAMLAAAVVTLAVLASATRANR